MKLKEYACLFYAGLILCKAELAPNINNAIIMLFPTHMVLCMAHCKCIKCICPKYFTV